MNVVGINLENGKIFESQQYTNENEKIKIEQAIQNDADSSNVTVEIKSISDEELKALIVSS